MATTSGSGVSNPIQEAPDGVPTHQLAMQAFSQLRNFHLPTPAIEDAEMTRAMIAVISSPAASSSSSSYHPQIPTTQRQCKNRRTAFRAYDPALAPLFKRRRTSFDQSKMKRLFAFLRTNRTQMQEIGSARTNNQLHHVISERKRREKLNENFEALKALLPPGSKKDKASVLSNTREYLTVLKDEVVELQKKKQSVEAMLFSKEESFQEEPGCERALPQVVDVCESSSSSGERRSELRVITREKDCDMIDLLIRILECLKQMKDVSPEFVDAGTQLNRMNRAIFNLKVQTSDWDQQSFKEAVTRAVGALANQGTTISQPMPLKEKGESDMMLPMFTV